MSTSPKESAEPLSKCSFCKRKGRRICQSCGRWHCNWCSGIKSCKNCETNLSSGGDFVGFRPPDVQSPQQKPSEWIFAKADEYMKEEGERALHLRCVSRAILDYLDSQHTK